MLGLTRKCCYLAGLFFVLFACLLPPKVKAAGHRESAVCSPKQDAAKDCGETCVFRNSVKSVFNAKKTAVVRVVCVSKQSSNSGNETGAKEVLAGTGFFISDRAHIATVASIVKNAQMIWVDYMGMSYAAECIGFDSQTNVAALRLLHPPSEFGIVDISESNSKKLAEIGSYVVFVGCKLGMDPAPELGLISGKNISYSDNQFLTTYLRTNLMFCGGESGAPVFELNGEIAGMMIASLPEMASSFILPKRALSKVFSEIISDGSVKHSSIGIEVQAECKFGAAQEIIISKVIAESEAERVGLRVGDVLKKIGTFDVSYKEDLYNGVFFCSGDDRIDVTVEREGKELLFGIKPEYITE
ncbi:MAG: S1C family serine protease [Puniceicoccales bacterium]|jgi:serine protease Do|nr:S1C family serine protease [Puniceicoccales bacterium]